MGQQPEKTLRLGAITADLDWAYRGTCSGERFDLALARSYIQVHVDRSLRFMALAASRGARLVLGPEYFRGSELFTCTLEQTRQITDPADAGTTRQLAGLAKQCGAHLAAAFDARHGDNLGQTGVLLGPDGSLIGTHVKQGTVRPGAIPRGLELWDTPLGRVGIAICADAEKPADMLDMAGRGMTLLLLPGCGFMGKHWREFVIVRAIDLKCVVVYSDETRAMIVSPRGEVVAETQRPNDVIVADVPTM